MGMDVTFLEHMEKQEKQIAKDIKKLADSIRSSSIKSLLEVMSLDSERHALFYEAVSDLLEPNRRMISSADMERIQEEVERHVIEKSQHLEDVKKIANSVLNPKVKIILNIIVDDEIRHHKLFQILKKTVMEKETIEEEDMWNRMLDPEIWMKDEL